MKLGKDSRVWWRGAILRCPVVVAVLTNGFVVPIPVVSADHYVVSLLPYWENRWDDLYRCEVDSDVGLLDCVPLPVGPLGGPGDEVFGSAVDRNGDTLAFEPGDPGRVVRIDLATAFFETVVDLDRAVYPPSDLAVRSSGRWLFTWPETLFEVDLNTGSTSSLGSFPELDMGPLAAIGGSAAVMIRHRTG
jgi:hypothetical protein